jgi:hypothetical protein
MGIRLRRANLCCLSVVAPDPLKTLRRMVAGFAEIGRYRRPRTLVACCAANVALAAIEGVAKHQRATAGFDLQIGCAAVPAPAWRLGDRYRERRQSDGAARGGELGLALLALVLRSQRLRSGLPERCGIANLARACEYRPQRTDRPEEVQNPPTRIGGSKSASAHAK